MIEKENTLFQITHDDIARNSESLVYLIITRFIVIYMK